MINIDAMNMFMECVYTSAVSRGLGRVTEHDI